MEKTEFISFLEETLIPDLKASGNVYTVKDLKSLVSFINGSKISCGRTQDEFVEFLERRLIPDLKESGSLLAEDFEKGIKFINK